MLLTTYAAQGHAHTAPAEVVGWQLMLLTECAPTLWLHEAILILDEQQLMQLLHRPLRSHLPTVLRFSSEQSQRGDVEGIAVLVVMVGHPLDNYY